jgi:hypothetical protein
LSSTPSSLVEPPLGVGKQSRAVAGAVFPDHQHRAGVRHAPPECFGNRLCDTVRQRAHQTRLFGAAGHLSCRTLICSRDSLSPRFRSSALIDDMLLPGQLSGRAGTSPSSPNTAASIVASSVVTMLCP